MLNYIIIHLLEFIIASLPAIFIFILYYFLIYLPQKKKQLFQTNVKPGMTIVTEGGLIGSIESIGEIYCIIKLHDGSHAAILKKAIKNQISF